MKLVLAFVFSLLSTAAMADASFCLSATPAGAPKQEACWGIRDDALADLLEAYAVGYFPNGVPDGNSVRQPTPAEILAAMGNGLKDGIIANVVSYKKAKAAKAAAEAVGDIVAVPK